ncbi:MAG: hypothetical protein GY870_16255, partial [archaeon]|nr:hypothetical protein [archaeon]
RSTVFEKATIQKYLKDKKYVVKHNDKITRNIYVNTRTDSGWCEFRLENLYNPPKGLTMLANTIQNKKQTYQSKMMS